TDGHVRRGRLVGVPGPVAGVTPGVDQQPAVGVADGGRPDLRVPARHGAHVRVRRGQVAVSLLSGERTLDGQGLADGDALLDGGRLGVRQQAEPTGREQDPEEQADQAETDAVHEAELRLPTPSIPNRPYDTISSSAWSSP